MSTTLPGRFPLHRLLIITLFAFALGVGINTFEVPVLSQRLFDLNAGLKNTAIGFITAAGLLIAIVTQPIVGAFSDRTRSALGRRIPYFIAGTVIVIVCMFLIALAPALGLVLSAYLNYQFGSNSIQGPWQALIPDQVPLEQHGITSGMKSVFEILAVIAGRRIGASLVASGNTLAAVLITATLFLITLLITAVFAREPSTSDQVFEPISITGSLIAAFKVDFKGRPAFLWWFINRALFWGGLIVLNTFLIFFLVDVMGNTSAQAQRIAANFFATFGFVVIPIALLAGWVSDRVGRRPLIALAGFLAGIGCALLLILKEPNQLLIVAGFIGVAGGSFISANWALLTDIVPTAEAARYMGVANIATASGSFMARFAGGALIDPLNRLTGSVTFGYTFMFLVTILAFLFSVFAIVKVRPAGTG